MGVQVLPLQSCHCTVSVGVGVPVQVPGLRVSVWPTVAVPVMVGAVWFVGALRVRGGGVWFGGGRGGAVTIAVVLEVAEVWPAVLVAVTTASMVKPVSV